MFQDYSHRTFFPPSSFFLSFFFFLLFSRVKRELDTSVGQSQKRLGAFPSFFSPEVSRTPNEHGDSCLWFAFRRVSGMLSSCSLVSFVRRTDVTRLHRINYTGHAWHKSQCSERPRDIRFISLCISIRLFLVPFPFPLFPFSLSLFPFSSTVSFVRANSSLPCRFSVVRTRASRVGQAWRETSKLRVNPGRGISSSASCQGCHPLIRDLDQKPRNAEFLLLVHVFEASHAREAWRKENLGWIPVVECPSRLSGSEVTRSCIIDGGSKQEDYFRLAIRSSSANRTEFFLQGI